VFGIVSLEFSWKTVVVVVVVVDVVAVV